MIGAEKISNLPGKYVFSLEQLNLTTKSNGYIGKMRSNTFGSFFNLYDHTDLIKNPNKPKTLGNNLMSISYV